jgi:hypothetical protein
VYNIADNEEVCTIGLFMYDFDNGSYEELDIDGHDLSKSCSFIYYVLTEIWIGDDGDGVLDGSEDGSRFFDDNDVFLIYDINTL